MVGAAATMALGWEGIAAGKGRGRMEFMVELLFVFFLLSLACVVHVLCVARPPKKLRR